jgi:hypothetical protein
VDSSISSLPHAFTDSVARVLVDERHGRWHTSLTGRMIDGAAHIVEHRRLRYVMTRRSALPTAGKALTSPGRREQPPGAQLRRPLRSG